MPHADPVWSTHQRLLSWNLDCKGSIWAACHAVSALENMVNPAARTTQSNFLTVKDPAWTGGAGNYALSNTLILWGDHADGTPPYTYRLSTDPVAQFMGIVDGATTNGSEQIMMPRQGIVANASTFSPSAVARWNPGAKTIVYDPIQTNVTNPNTMDFRNVASLMTYGRGFDNLARGYVMYQPAHSHNKATAPANIASQRAFFNFSFFSLRDKNYELDLSGLPPTISGPSPVNLTASILVGPPGAGPYTISWTSSCGGTFAAPNPASVPNGSFPIPFSKIFTPPAVFSTTNCIISVTVTDACGRKTVETKNVQLTPCVLTFNNMINPVVCNGQSNGSIAMNISGASGPYTWNWSRVPAGTGMGSGTTISGLAAGTYNVTVTGSGNCSGTFTALVPQPNAISASATATNYLCFGQTGSINVSATGGTPAYTYAWSGAGSGTNPRTNLLAGSYTVTVTDMNGCTQTASATVTGPTTPVVVSSTKTNVSCNGGNNGTIDLSASGGTPGYTYAWSGSGSGSDPRTNLAAGIYTATITDMNGCTAIKRDTITQPPVLIISLLKTDPTCPPGANPINNNGAITVTASGGTAGYQVVWTGPPSGNPAGVEIAMSGGNYNIPNLPAGTYTITVTDLNGCVASAMITLTGLNALPNPPSGINNN
jgi:hypothetical protein